MPQMMRVKRAPAPPRPAAADELARTIGARLRQVRKAQRVTLVELAKASGVDSATISRIETGTMTGTMESHLKLARGLGVKLSDVYAGLEEARAARTVSAQAPSARKEVYVHQAGKSAIAMLTNDVLKKKLMPVLVTVEPGGTTQREEAKVGTEKFLYVLDGQLEAQVGQQRYALGKGSTLYFEASLPHSLRNPGRKPARCLAVTTPPAL